ncbi:PLD nuclease N-terminal domain-containing protein [Streptomyces inhibens]|uniref:PLD nuclease N-terminal domain-containing protein n=1 Tax=Streptomyces inhibens TaxID=2293571 RepID=UPI001EE6A69F|nr:PLD nuclease N-terminal domain-containing protein [Streptomyces inhibens]UKY54948.1 PLD nuclease N-terminal domain-containing protein [Streptomyces inhibens]
MHTVLAGQHHLLALSGRALSLTGAGILIALSAAYVVLFVGALVSIVRARMDGGMKLVRLVFAFVAPFLGSLLWFLIGRRRLTPRQNT